MASGPITPWQIEGENVEIVTDFILGGSKITADGDYRNEIKRRCKEIQPVPPKGNQSWLFIGKTDAEAETPILWPPDGKNWFIWKFADAGKVWRWEEKAMTEDEMVGWYHWLNGHEFEQAPGVDDGQGSPAVHGVAKCWAQLSDWTELNWMMVTS